MLKPGARLGAYEIVLPLGAGGMGEVYRARDGRLNRDVAIKVLPPAVAADPERLARFRREAQTLAAFNHPNIAHIHGLEEIDGLPALVMELVDGQDLAARIVRGPVPLDEALPIARQIADALDAAHAQGIVHRDLKPANVMLRADGTVKVLDFGLAKALDPLSASAAAAALAQSPTITSPAALTGAGVILGTAAYMSPEQARGKAVDKRSDLWAFGAVLFEMLTGRRAFAGDEVTDTIASVIAKEPDWSALPAVTPPAIHRLLRRCLEKDRQRRLSDAADARLEIDEALAPPAAGAADDPSPSPAPARRRAAPWIAGALGLGLGAVIVLLAWAPWRRSAPAQPLRVSADLGVDASLTGGLGDIVALSPDATVVAFVAHQGAGRPRLYVRPLHQLQATPLAGTDEASSPFFSPDGRWLAFFANERLKKIAVSGGAVVTLCDAPNGRGGSWAEDGDIVFARYSPDTESGGALRRVSSAGGTPVSVTALAAGDVSQRWPQVLPGGGAILFTASRDAGDYRDSDLVIQTPGGARKVVQRGAYHGRYLPGGFLAYIHDETLFIAPFDLGRLEVTGPPAPMIEDVVSNVSTGAAQFAASAGTMLYLAGRAGLGSPISWWRRDGTIAPMRTTPVNWFALRFSPDGRRLAMNATGVRSGISIYDHEQDTARPLPDSSPRDTGPIWTPDGRRIAFASRRDGRAAANIYWQPIDGSGAAERLTDSPHPQMPGSWHPDGKTLVFQEQVAPGNFDLMLLPVGGQPAVFVSTPASETDPAFSPDGRWVAYVSNESGRSDVYVRPFRGSGKWRVSTDGGMHPTWSRTKQELFYGTDDGQIMSVPTAVDGDAFRAGKPRPWADGRFAARVSRMFDLHPDGDRFAIAPAQDLAPPGGDRLTLIVNLVDELRRLAPAAKK